MNKKKAKIAAFIVALIGVPLITIISFGNVTLSLNSSEIQDLIDKKIPFSSENGEANVEKLTVLIEDNQLNMNTRVSGKKFGQVYSGEINAVGVPVYHNGALYFATSEIDIIEVSVNGITGENNLASKAKDKLLGLSKRYITNEGARNVIEDTAPAVEEWVRKAPENAAVYALNKFPVYRIKDDVKGFFVKSSLSNDSIRIVNNELVLKISFFRITLILLIWAVIFIAAIALVFFAPNTAVAITATDVVLDTF